MSVDGLRVPVDRLAQRCNAADLGFETTADVEPLEGTIGQERAISALELGLDIDADGFNLFIAGPSGTGRNTALRSYVDRIALKKQAPPDWGYVYNFQEPAHPISISLPCGMVRLLCRQMDDLGPVHTTTNQIRHLGDPSRVAGIRMPPSYVDLALRVISVNRP